MRCQTPFPRKINKIIIIKQSSVSVVTDVVKINPFIPEFLKWTLPSLILDRTIVSNRDLSQIPKQNGKQCIS